MNKIREATETFCKHSDCDVVAVAKLDFNNHSFESVLVFDDKLELDNKKIYFDLASLTKPLTNSLVRIANNIDDTDLNLVLNHRGGLPAWGLLSNKNWKEQILNYKIQKSETLYSDFSALRFMLEVEKLKKCNYKDLVFKNLDEEIKFWMDLDQDDFCLQNGYYNQMPNIGKVHDPNAFNLKTFNSHAGLFGTIEGVAKTLLKFDKDHKLLDLMSKKIMPSERFCYGFDTVANPENTLAGAGCSDKTFGHLGFTGTSFWIDSSRKVGHIILTNSTKYYWYDKEGLNQFRRYIGEIIWNE